MDELFVLVEFSPENLHRLISAELHKGGLTRIRTHSIFKPITRLDNCERVNFRNRRQQI